MAEEYDVIIIGGGAAGENVAGRTSPGGLSTVIIDSELVGGECTYWACMPSKALLRPAETLKAATRVPAAAGAVTGDVDAEKALRSRDAFANGWDDYWQVKWVESVEADLIRGHARITGERQVSVELAGGGVQELVARKAVVIATGSTPALPAIKGIEDVGAWTSRDIVTAKEVPESLIILGAGPVGLEMAQAWKSLGTKSVTLIERRLPEELTRIEPFAMTLVLEALAEDGVVVRMPCIVHEVSRKDGVVAATMDQGETLSAAEVVVATGRQPNTGNVGLETIGLPTEGPIKVEDSMQAVGVDGGWLYAVGDVNGRGPLTHQGKYQARQAGDHILGKGTGAWADNIAIPAVIFTDPQIASVGLTEARARAQGIPVKVVELGLVGAAASLAGKDLRGGVKFVVDEQRNVLVGATFVGPTAGEMLHATTIAIVGEVTLDTLWHAVPAFPTMSELWLRFLESYGY
jgi:pyruvate/2-oxoglutarate dehydrogenase complex dihydrolipoamide dehydrogenase (E3) component